MIEVIPMYLGGGKTFEFEFNFQTPSISLDIGTTAIECTVSYTFTI